MSDADRPVITPEVIERFAAYYRRHPTWGSLHIVLDDDNLADSHVEFCIGWALGEGDSEGHELACLLRSMTRSQRARIGRRAEAQEAR